MPFTYDKKNYGCPVCCQYCVVTKVDSRRAMWNKKTLIGINKAVTALNPPPDLEDNEAVEAFYNFPLELLKGDIVGFNAISDPFWPKYRKELDYFLANVPKIAKLVTCVTKLNPDDALLERLSKITNFRLVVSITGLDKIEKTTTKSRLDLLRRAKQFGIKAFPLVHPYIAGLSDLSFLKDLKEMGYDHVDVKGLRYNRETMTKWIPEEARGEYEARGDQETLVEDGWRARVADSGLSLMSLKDWYKEGMPNLPKLTLPEAEHAVNKLLQLGNITSSDTDRSVVKSAVTRRL
jgi:DNA repair photolyase